MDIRAIIQTNNLQRSLERKLGKIKDIRKLVSPNRGPRTITGITWKAGDKYKKLWMQREARGIPEFPSTKEDPKKLHRCSESSNCKERNCAARSRRRLKFPTTSILHKLSALFITASTRTFYL